MKDERRETLARTIEDRDKVIEPKGHPSHLHVAPEGAELGREPADAIVIPKSDLPEVHAIGGTTHQIDGSVYTSTPSPQWCRAEARRLLALAEHLDAQDPRPLAVGDRVRVVKLGYANGTRTRSLAVGDVGEVSKGADDDGDILFCRDGTAVDYYIAAANVERIEGER